MKREERKPDLRSWARELVRDELDVVRVPTVAGIADDVALM